MILFWRLREGRDVRCVLFDVVNFIHHRQKVSGVWVDIPRDG
jgi:hypothetical protein